MKRCSVTSITWLFAILSFNILVGCASTRLTAFTDPAFSGKSFTNPAVYANTADLEWRRSLEESVVAEMRKLGLPAVTTFELIPPTRDLNPEDRVRILLENKIDTLIVIEVRQSGVEEQYIPPTGATTTTSGTVSTYGNTGTYQGTSYTTVHGGYNVSKPWAEMRTFVLDVASGRKARVASSFTGGNAFASFQDIRKSYSKKIVEQLLADRVLASPSPSQ